MKNFNIILIIILVIGVFGFSFLVSAGVFFVAACFVPTLTFTWLNAFAVWITGIILSIVIKFISWLVGVIAAAAS